MERVEGRCDHRGGARGRLDRIEGLEAVAGDVDHDPLVGPDHAVGGQPLERVCSVKTMEGAGIGGVPAPNTRWANEGYARLLVWI